MSFLNSVVFSLCTQNGTENPATLLPVLGFKPEHGYLHVQQGVDLS